MPKVISLPDDLFDRLGTLARPFVDKDPADVIRWLVEKELEGVDASATSRPRLVEPGQSVAGRAPRERGAVIDMDGTIIHADSVPDLCTKVMQYLYSKGHWNKVLALSPYKTSPQRYLFSKTAKHPNGNDFWVQIKYRELIVEGHKNYKTAVEQLTRLAAKCGVMLTYKGT